MSSVPDWVLVSVTAALVVFVLLALFGLGAGFRRRGFKL